MDYNQPLVGGPSVHPTPATQIGNLQLDGGSSVERVAYKLHCMRRPYTVLLTCARAPRKASLTETTTLAPRGANSA